MGKNKRFVNAQTREEIAYLAHMGGTIDSIIKSFIKYDKPFKLKYLKMANSFLDKFLNENVYRNEVLDNRDRKSMINFVGDSEIKLTTKTKNRIVPLKKHKTTKHNEIIEISKDYLEDVLKELVNEKCLGCKGIEDCKVRLYLEKADIPAIKETPKYCKYELIIGEEVVVKDE